MLSIKLYQSFLKPSFTELYRKNLILIKSKGYVKIAKNQRLNKNGGNSSGMKKFVAFGIGGCFVNYVFCAAWEYESIKAKLRRKTSVFTQLFIQIFRRPPKSEDIFWVIAGLNVLVHLMFRFYNVSHSMKVNFPLSIQSNPVSLLLSMFTHFQTLHMIINLYVLHSFSPLINYFGAPHFMAIYISGGLISGLGSVLHKSIKGFNIPSVGASGAIMTILAMFASMNPDLKFGIPIISDIIDFNFSAKSAIIGLIAFDLSGLLFFKNSKLDHVCHITGVLYGIFYGLIGKSLIWETRGNWMSWYYHLRSG